MPALTITTISALSRNSHVHWKSVIVSNLLIVVVFFGLCGAFISNLSGIPKIHYIPLFAAIVLVIALTVSKKLIFLYLVAVVCAVAAPLFASDQNSYLAYFSSMVLPFFWFCAGSRIDMAIVARGFAYLSLILLIGLLLELSGSFDSLFPVITYNIGEDVGQRYGSFGINPLALGYFASIAGVLAFALPKKIYVRLAIVMCMVLLLAANSRGAIATFLVGIILMLYLKKDRILNVKNVVVYVGMLLVILSIFVAAIMLNERFRSTFDWSNDQGNIGRLIQWTYCSSQAAQHPIGLGAGSMSPIGIDDNAYIEEGIVKSCDSTILQISAEYGILIATIYLSIIIRFLIIIWKRTRILSLEKMQISPHRSSLVVASSVVWAIALQQIMNQTLQSIWIGAVFFSLLGYVYWQPKIYLKPDQHELEVS